MKTQSYDVAVVGAGPAGATAAILLGRSGRRTALIDRFTFPRSGASVGWLGARATPLLETMGLPLTSILEQPFTDVAFYNADFSKSAAPSFAEAPGFLIDRTAFTNVLVETAAAGGVRLHAGSSVSEIDRFEDHVLVHVAGAPPIRARLLILASGRGTPLLEKSDVRGTACDAMIRSCTVEADVRGRGRPTRGSDATRPTQESDATGPRVAVVLGLDHAGSFALSLATPQRALITLNWLEPEAERQRSSLPSPATFARICRSLYENEAVGVNLTEAVLKAPILSSPTSFALDMESHVGKNMLVVGDAGGFVGAGSSESIYPAMWSARIAAEVVNEALESKHGQDTLMSFEHKWRHTMADYLRPPHTDIHFLLPLIFSNQTMANRMGAAFFCGENI